MFAKPSSDFGLQFQSHALGGTRDACKGIFQRLFRNCAHREVPCLDFAKDRRRSCAETDHLG